MTTVKALILDPVHGEPTFSRLKQRLEGVHGWQVRTVPMYVSGMDGKSWIGDFERSLDWATAIIGLGDFIAFSITGAPEKYLEKLVAKTNDRCALILQLPLLSESDPAIPNSVLRNWDVQRTPYRLYAETGDHPYTIELLRGDRCFNDRDLAKGIDRISISDASIIDYDGEAVPSVIGSELLLPVDKTTDFPRANQIGQRDAVIVVRTPSIGGLQVFIGGNALKDPIDVMAGRLPGIDDNQALLDNLVLLAEDATASPPYSKQVHDAFDVTLQNSSSLS